MSKEKEETSDTWAYLGFGLIVGLFFYIILPMHFAAFEVLFGVKQRYPPWDADEAYVIWFFALVLVVAWGVLFYKLGRRLALKYGKRLRLGPGDEVWGGLLLLGIFFATIGWRIVPYVFHLHDNAMRTLIGQSNNYITAAFIVGVWAFIIFGWIPKAARWFDNEDEE